MTVKTVAQALQTKIKELTPQNTPTPYFDHVWIGMPEKIPQGDRRVAIIEASNTPEYYYTTGPNCKSKATLYEITLLSIGKPETAYLDIYEVTDIVEDAINSDTTLTGAVENIQVQNTIYGDIAEPGNRKLIAASKITLISRIS